MGDVAKLPLSKIMDALIREINGSSNFPLN
jgi:hypothetical protein